jgi:hypothetical protein
MQNTSKSTFISILLNNPKISSNTVAELMQIYDNIITQYLVSDFHIIRSNITSFNICEGCGYFNYDDDFAEIEHRGISRFGFLYDADRHVLCKICVADRRINNC